MNMPLLKIIVIILTSGKLICTKICLELYGVPAILCQYLKFDIISDSKTISPDFSNPYIWFAIHIQLFYFI